MYGCDENRTGRVDSVITTREVGRLIVQTYPVRTFKEERSLTNHWDAEAPGCCHLWCDRWCYGAALRSACYFLTGENPAPDAFKVVRGRVSPGKAEVEIAGTKSKSQA